MVTPRFGSGATATLKSQAFCSTDGGLQVLLSYPRLTLCMFFFLMCTVRTGELLCNAGSEYQAIIKDYDYGWLLACSDDTWVS